MPTRGNRFASVRRQVDAYEESWEQDHREAMACRDCEDTIAAGISVFQLLERTDQAWRDRVFRGVEPYSEEDDHLLQTLFRGWLRVTENLLSVLPPLENQFGSVAGADELRSCAETTGRLLGGWAPPRLSAAVGLRETALSPEAAAELDRILEEGKTNPPPMPSTRMETRDSER